MLNSCEASRPPKVKIANLPPGWSGKKLLHYCEKWRENMIFVETQQEIIVVVEKNMIFLFWKMNYLVTSKTLPSTTTQQSCSVVCLATCFNFLFKPDKIVVDDAKTKMNLEILTKRLIFNLKKIASTKNAPPEKKNRTSSIEWDAILKSDVYVRISLRCYTHKFID